MQLTWILSTAATWAVGGVMVNFHSDLQRPFLRTITACKLFPASADKKKSHINEQFIPDILWSVLKGLMCQWIPFLKPSSPQHSFITGWLQCFGICKGVSSALLIYFSLGRSLSLTESFIEVPKGLQGKLQNENQSSWGNPRSLPFRPPVEKGFVWGLVKEENALFK